MFAQQPAGCKVVGYALCTTGMLRKYSSILDIFLSSLSNHCYLAFCPMMNYRAMAAHVSQFVWYRRLFVLFSRYTFINTFKPIHVVLHHRKTKQT
jgi:N-acetylglucosaminylphosphatidylinositol deacetylase